MIRQGNERETFFGSAATGRETFSELMNSAYRKEHLNSWHDPFGFVTTGVRSPLLQDPPGPTVPPETPRQPVPPEEPIRPPAPEKPRQPVPQEEPRQPGAPEHPPRQVPPEHPG
ncbi:MAG: hypothetical protein ACLFT3_12735 [Cyclobacteriaceae bacterium]